jgi:hypothetical protein
MKKIFLTIFISLLVLPISAFAVSESLCTSQGGTYSAGDCTCPKSSNGISQTWSGDECACVGQYTKVGTECKIVTSGGSSVAGQTQTSNCAAIVCEAKSSCSGNSCQGSTDREQGHWSSSLGKCACPAGYYSNEAPTEGGSSSSSSSSSGSGSSSGGSSSSGSSGSSGSTTITMPTVTSTGILTNPITSTSFTDLIDKVIGWILNIALVLAPLVIVYGGFLYMTAAGDTNKISMAKNIILYAVIGFMVALLAKSLIGIFTGLVVK